jgi:hypothetical protein
MCDACYKNKLASSSWWVSSWRTMEIGLNLGGGSWGFGVINNLVQETSDGEQNSCGGQGHAQPQHKGSEAQTTPRWCKAKIWSLECRLLILNHILPFAETWNSACAKELTGRNLRHDYIWALTLDMRKATLKTCCSSNCSREIPPCSSLRGAWSISKTRFKQMLRLPLESTVVMQGNIM